MFDYSELCDVLFLDLRFAIPTQILNTESLGTSHSMRRAKKKNATGTEADDAQHEEKTQNGKQWKKIRVDEKMREKNCETQK